MIRKVNTSMIIHGILRRLAFVHVFADFIATRHESLNNHWPDLLNQKFFTFPGEDKASHHSYIKTTFTTISARTAVHAITTSYTLASSLANIISMYASFSMVTHANTQIHTSQQPMP